MKIGFVSRFGDGAALALDAIRDGHEAKIWIQDPKRRHEIFEGLISKVEKYEDFKGWADLLFFDANHLDKEKLAVQKWGVPLWNGSPEASKLEDDRGFARDLFEKQGMKPLISETRKTIEEAIKFIQGEKGLWVTKMVGGDSDSEDVSISEYEDGQDVIAVLQRYADSGKKYDAVEIEERVIGIEMGCASYYSHGKRVGPIEISFQHKEPADGWPGSSRGLGALCGESGTVAVYVTEANKFYKETLGRFSEYLKKIDFTGEADIGCMVDEKGVKPLEWTIDRPGYPDCFLRRPLAKTSQMEFFHSCAIGKPIEFKTIPGWACCFLLMTPGFPYQEAVEKHSAGYPVIGYDEKNINMHLQEVKKGKRSIEVANGCGYSAVVSGRGDTIESARRNAHWLVAEANPKRLFIPKMAIRADIGLRVIDQLEEIKELGWMTPEEMLE